MLSPGRSAMPLGKKRSLSLVSPSSRRLLVETLEDRLALSASVGSEAPTSDVIALSSNAVGLSSDNVVRDWVGWYDRYDVYELQVAERSRISIELTQLSSDLNLSLHDAQQNPIAISERPLNQSELISGQISPGSYWVKVQPDQFYDISSYELRVRMESIAPAPADVESPSSQDPATVDPPPRTTVDVFPDVAYFGGRREWSLNEINAPEAWAQGYTGSDVVVAVLDTGVDLDHADLDASLWTNSLEIAGNGIDDDRNGFVDDVHGWDFWADDNTTYDSNGHGTHVAGIIASERNSFGSTGVAYGAQIMPVQVLGSNGSGSMYDVAAGIRYAVDNGADIINLSLGSSASSQTMRSAIQYADRNDVLIVAAAGNRGAAAPEFPARYGATFDNVLSVGAYSSSGALAGFSNKVGASGVTQVDAPGVGVFSSYSFNRSATLSGTSMATPQVAGLAALALSANPQLSSQELIQLIVDGASQTVARSDSGGGVNAAWTVAQAIGYQASANAARGVGSAAGSGTMYGRYRTQQVDVSYVDLSIRAALPTAPTTFHRMESLGEPTPERTGRRIDRDTRQVVLIFDADESRAARHASADRDLHRASDEAFASFDWLKEYD